MTNVTGSWAVRGVLLGTVVTLSGLLPPMVDDLVEPAYSEVRSAPERVPARWVTGRETGLRLRVPAGWQATSSTPREDVDLLLVGPDAGARAGSIAVLRTDLEQMPRRSLLARTYRDRGFAVAGVRRQATPLGTGLRAEYREGTTLTTTFVIELADEVVAITAVRPDGAPDPLDPVLGELRVAAPGG